MSDTYNVHERFQLIDQNTKKIVATQHMFARLLCAFAVGSGNKDEFIKIIQETKSIDPSMDESIEYAKQLMLTTLERTHLEP